MNPAGAHRAPTPTVVSNNVDDSSAKIIGTAALQTNYAFSMHRSSRSPSEPREAARGTTETPRVFARLPTVIQATGLGRSTIYRMVASGVFPAPVQLGARAVAWRWSDLDRWSDTRRSALVDPRSAPRAESQDGAARPQAQP
jgi:prophage regulatory protein